MFTWRISQTLDIETWGKFYKGVIKYSCFKFRVTMSKSLVYTGISDDCSHHDTSYWGPHTSSSHCSLNKIIVKYFLFIVVVLCCSQKWVPAFILNKFSNMYKSFRIFTFLTKFLCKHKKKEQCVGFVKHLFERSNIYFYLQFSKTKRHHISRNKMDEMAPCIVLSLEDPFQFSYKQ